MRFINAPKSANQEEGAGARKRPVTLLCTVPTPETVLIFHMSEEKETGRNLTLFHTNKAFITPNKK